MSSFLRVNRGSQGSRRELVMNVGCLYLADLLRLRVVWYRAGHVEQRLNGRIAPRSVLWKPLPYSLMDVELSHGLELEHERRREVFCIAAYLEQRFRTDPLCVRQSVGARGHRNDRPVVAAIN